MDLRFHFLASGVLAIILYPFFGLSSLLVFIGGYFVDLDHYLYSAITTRSFSLKKGYMFYKTPWKKRKFVLHLFHTVEIWTTILILSIFYKEAAIIGAGLVLHMGMDFFDGYRLGYSVGDIRATSIIEWIIKRNKITINPLPSHLQMKLGNEGRIF